jgi:hypothetical protein
MRLGVVLVLAHVGIGILSIALVAVPGVDGTSTYFFLVQIPKGVVHLSVLALVSAYCIALSVMSQCKRGWRSYYIGANLA